MVVLWPKMKAPQTSVKAPQRVRMTLGTQNASSITSGTWVACRHGDQSTARGRNRHGNQQSQHCNRNQEPVVVPSDRTWSMSSHVTLRGLQVSADIRYQNSGRQLARTGVASVHASGIPSTLERWKVAGFILPGPPGHGFRLHGKHQTESCSKATQRLSGGELAARWRSRALG